MSEDTAVREKTGLRPAATAMFGPIETRIGYLLHRTDLLHMDTLRLLLTPMGLTPARATAIAYFSNNPGAGQSDLARAIGISRASAMEMIDQLEGIAAIERRPGRNLRTNALWLTAKGEQLHEQFLNATVEVDRLVTTGLDEAERAELERLLQCVRGSLSEHLRRITDNDGK